jgi:FkbM family methyltransferase
MKRSDGSKFQIPMFDPVVAEHFAKESSLTGTLLKQIEDGMYAEFFENKKNLTFLDIGANIGLVSIYASPACSRIVAVEPSPDTFKVLQAMTGSLSQIERIRFALTPRDGPHKFFVNDINSTASSTVNTYGQKTLVEGLTLSSILRIYQLEHVDVCKIDAEGGEGSSLNIDELKSAQNIIKSYYIETHNCPNGTWMYKLGHLVERLSSCGYHHHKIDGMTLYATT